MKIKTVLLLLTALLLTACNSHVHEPWVAFPGYLKKERSVSPALNKRLQHRVHYQNDR